MKALLALIALLPAALTAQNSPPTTPQVTEPATPGQRVNPSDVHMESSPFFDVDVGDVHLQSDWEIRTLINPVLVWEARGVTGPEMLHAHFGDGAFVGPLAGRTRLDSQTAYVLRVRHRDDSGDPATEWSGWAQQIFITLDANQNLPLSIDDVQSDPEPRWEGPNGPIDLPTGTINPSLTLETGAGALFLRVDADAGPGNVLTNPGPIASHAPARLVFRSGNAGRVVIPESTLTFAEHGCDVFEVLLPAIDVGPGQTLYYWASFDGATYIGDATQTHPDYSAPARNFVVPWTVREPGYRVDIVASGLRLPVNLAFVPNAGTAPSDPKFYVTELYGDVKTVTNDGTVLTFASSLLNFTPSGAFPGSGEMGLTGIAVDPVTGDVFVSVLQEEPGVGTNHEPRIVRFTSTDGGRTAATATTIHYMPGEYQGQSHQISNLEIVNGELYCHMGDGFNASTARNLGSYRGKILRLNLDGTPVATNPFYNPSFISARDYVYAYGVRNPFGGAWRAADGARYMVENGPSVDRFAKIVRGRDYGWAGSDSHMFNHALYNWNPASGPVNLAFVQPETFGGSGFPPEKQGLAYVSESGATYARGQQQVGKRITEWELDAAGNRVRGPTPFVEYIGDGRATVVGLAAGPDGLYFTELYKDLNTSGPTDIGARVIRIRPGAVTDCNNNDQPDWCEIATGRVTDFNHNEVPDECETFQEDADSISLSAGGTVNFTIRAGAQHAGKTYLVLGSSTGTSPGITLPTGAVLPLNALNNDGWFFMTLLNPNSVLLPGSLGTLDGNGEASAALWLPPNTPPVLAGLQLHHACAVFDPTQGFVDATIPVPMTLVP